MVRYLVDSSAWVRLHDPRIPERRVDDLADAAADDRIWASTILALEQGYAAPNATAYARDVAVLEDLPFAEVDASISARARDLQRQLARVGHHRLPIADLLVIATAEPDELTVLHYDKHFDVILDKTDCVASAEWLAPRGTL